MAITVDPYYAHVANHPIDGVRPFTVYWYRTATNDPDIYLRKVDCRPIFDGDADIVIKDVFIDYDADTSGAGVIVRVLLKMWHGAAPRPTVSMDIMKGVADAQKAYIANWHGDVLMNIWRDTVPDLDETATVTDPMVARVVVSGGAGYATDAVGLVITGELRDKPENAPITPVSVEGYKWPLERRT